MRKPVMLYEQWGVDQNTHSHSLISTFVYTDSNQQAHDVSTSMQGHDMASWLQGLHRLEKYLNIKDCLEKSLKIKFALKSTWKTLKGFEKSLNFTINRRIQQCFGDLNQYKIVVPLFGAAYAAPN